MSGRIEGEHSFKVVTHGFSTDEYRCLCCHHCNRFANHKEQEFESISLTGKCWRCGGPMPGTLHLTGLRIKKARDELLAVLNESVVLPVSDWVASILKRIR